MKGWSKVDFYFDLGMAVILRLLKDKRSIAKYAAPLAKLFLALRDAADVDKTLEKEIRSKDKREV